MYERSSTFTAEPNRHGLSAAVRSQSERTLGLPPLFGNPCSRPSDGGSTEALNKVGCSNTGLRSHTASGNRSWLLCDFGPGVSWIEMAYMSGSAVRLVVLHQIE